MPASKKTPHELVRAGDILRKNPCQKPCAGCRGTESYAASKRGFGGNTTPRKAPRK